MGRVLTEIFAYYFGSSAQNYIWTFFLLLECLLMLPDLASVFTPSADDTLLPLSLPKALGGNLLTHSSPPRGATTVDLPTQKATQPGPAFCCTLGWWWVGCYGAVCAHGGHLERGGGEEGRRKAVCTWIWGNGQGV